MAIMPMYNKKDLKFILGTERLMTLKLVLGVFYSKVNLGLIDFVWQKRQNSGYLAH